MIELKNLSMKLPGFALKDISLKVEKGEYFIILGPTGAGKTLLLETIAGIYTPSAGDITIEGESVTGKPPEERGVSIVYQDQALFPHMSVRKNILFGLRVSKEDPARQAETLEWISNLLGIKDLLQRRPTTLSGGERQKVALARALAVRPELLLLDEPLSALDPESREKLQDELRRIHAGLGITILHVTHDFEEAMTLGQRIAVLNRGSICQTGSPDDIFLRPSSAFIARYTMSRNIFNGRQVAGQDDGIFFETDTGWQMEVAAENSEADCACIRPELIKISRTQPQDTPNAFQGKVSGAANRGAYNIVRVNLPPELFCYVPRLDGDGIETGQQVWLSFEPQAVHLFNA